MIHECNSSLWKSFFELTSVGGLRRFAAGLDASSPENAALAYYISTWPAFANTDNGADFVPTHHLSTDRSAVKYGNAPVIFEGSNHWAWKPYVSTEALAQELDKLEHLVCSVRDSNPSARITLVLIPEKDHVISRYLRKETRFDTLEKAVGALSGHLVAQGIAVVFSQPFVEIDRFLSLGDFEYNDSHLPSRYYVTIFGFILQAMGISWAPISSKIGLKQVPEFGDLSVKFNDTQPNQTLAFQPDVPGTAAIQTAGTESFAKPLGETWQEFQSEKAIIDQSVCILGDSHSSIYSMRKLTYLFASTFRNTHFEWNPCGIRKTPDVSISDHIILEMSSRFAV
jgi:hypothetical protein